MIVVAKGNVFADWRGDFAELGGGVQGGVDPATYLRPQGGEGSQVLAALEVPGANLPTRGGSSSTYGAKFRSRRVEDRTETGLAW